eukprot:TRINITY_DN8626_c0_g1_i1.p1 TRINITY_DN8626_c0_g1~~TRINITY_DN8626_c0_g1_i1.p1  ORF type:complete len:270 (-),score=60.50 TRINITY_DN8626_c0_g1_i1:87-842(-)
MKTSLLLLFVVLSLADGDLLMEVGFDLALKTETDSGFRPTDALTMYLQSTNLKWFRSFHTLLSGQGPKPQRLIYLAFQDFGRWAAWEDEFLVKSHALFDHFWLKSQLQLWSEVPVHEQYPHSDRTEERPGGFVWQLKYTVLPGKDAEWEKFLQKHIDSAIPLLQKGTGFVEAKSYVSLHQRLFRHMLSWEFLSMSDLSRGVFESHPMQTMFDKFSQYLEEWNSVVMAPPTDENEEQAGYFYPAAGADKSDE